MVSMWVSIGWNKQSQGRSKPEAASEKNYTIGTLIEMFSLNVSVLMNVAFDGTHGLQATASNFQLAIIFRGEMKLW